MKKPFALHCCTFFCLLVFALLQQPARAKFTTRLFQRFDATKLPSPFVKAIHQDKAGFIWLGTRAGLCRFDGENYLTFSHKPGKPESLGHNNIRSIWEDRSGKLWLATFGSGISCYNPVNQTFQNFSIPNSPMANRVHQLLGDAEGNLWLATEGGGLFQFLVKEKRFVFFKFPGRYNNWLKDLRSLFINRKGDIWVGGAEGKLFRLSPKTRRFRVVKNMPATTTWDMVPISDTLLALGTLNGLMGLNTNTLKVNQLADMQTKPALLSNLILDLCSDRFGRIWIATAHGLAIYHPEKKTTELFNYTPFISHSLPDNRLLGLFADRHGLMWLGTWNEGFCHTPVKETGFVVVENMPGLPKDSAIENIQKVAWDAKGNLWASSWHGLVQVNLSRKKVNKSMLDTSKPGRLPTNRLWGILSDSKNRLWVGTHYQGLYLKKDENSALKKIDTLSGFFSKLPFTSEIVEDRKGRIWVGTFENGLAKWHENENRFEIFSLKDKLGNAVLALNQINTIQIGPDANLWLGTNGGGLVVFDPGTHQYRLVGAENGLSNSNILNMAFTRNTVWVSTEGGGVFYSKIQNPLVFQSLNRQIGLSDLNLPVVQADKRGNLWLAGAGLYRIPSAGQNPVGIRSFETMQSGNLLTPQRFQASAISDKGWLALGSNRGFVLFHPDSIGLPARPEVALSGWTTEEKKQALDSALENKRYLIISPENQYFNLRISNLNFFGQDKSQCFYKLEGVHKNWVKAGPSALTEISGLSPGTFQFRFWAGNEQGLKSEEKTIWIKKLPHWYQTLWFYGICIGLFAGLSGLYSHWRINRARKEGFEKAKAEREKLELEVKALRAQMNPHFMFNALNSIDHFIWKNDTLQASDYLARFSRLMRKVLEHSRLEMITLAEEMESLEMYIHLEQLRMESPFGLDIQADTQTPVSEILIPPMCIQPFVENAILHGLLPLSTQGKLCIGFNQIARNQLKVTVEDNGVGRKPEPAPEAADRRSLGMTIIKERIKKIQPFR